MSLQVERGQATAEMLITMLLLTLITFGLLHLALLIAGRHMTNYAAFAAARTAMVRGSIGHPETRRAVRDAMRRFAWPRGVVERPQGGSRGGRTGVIVPFHMPMGRLIDPDPPALGFRIEGFAMTAIQPPIPEEGDNAAPR